MNTALQVGALVAGGPLATVHRGSLHGRAVAIKRARCEVPGAAAALRREARVLTAATHPAIVPVVEVLDDPLAPALILGWADGGSFGDLLADGPLGHADLIQVLRPLADGLEALHLGGAAHLDVTVENVLLAAAGPVLIDPAPPGSGTPGYADPAVAAGGPASSRSDVFGLAACAHLALTGRLPRPTGGVAVGAALTDRVAEVLAAALDPDPRRRPASPAAFVRDLEGALAAAPGAGLADASARPVVRAPRDAPAPARTWPFDRWQEETDAAAERRAELAALGGEAPKHGRKRHRPALAVLAVVAACGSAAVALQWPESSRPSRQVRPSASDSTRRPPAARPPPTATPGGNP